MDKSILEKKVHHMYMTGGTGVLKKNTGEQILVKSSTLQLTPDKKMYLVEREDGKTVTILIAEIADAHPSL